MQEPKVFTDAYLRKLSCDGQRKEITDAGCIGLRVRIAETGKKTFLLKVRNAASQLKTVTLGHYPEMSLREARIAATRAKLDLKAGKDINAGKRLLRILAQQDSADPTLRELLEEYETMFRTIRKSWAPRGKASLRSGARAVIESVLEHLLDGRVTDLKLEQFGKAINEYRPKRALKGKSTANGQASRARAYLMPVLDWASGRKSFSKIGAGRVPRLDVVSLDQIHDPSKLDPTIKGDRDRVLTEVELRKILPWLTYPARRDLGLRISVDLDHRPVAMRFMLLTAARREEVENMRWRDLDPINGVWRKPQIKSTRGGQRGQSLPISAAILDLLVRLPGHGAGNPDAFVFPNSKGGQLDNWQRLQEALYRVTGTSGWHRHDLRRTASTIMQALKVPASTIDQILGHTDPLRRENVSGAASHYLRVTRIMKDIRDPQEEALSELATALDTLTCQQESQQ